MTVFIDLWSCFLTTKLSYAQLLKWGHSTYIMSYKKVAYPLTLIAPSNCKDEHGYQKFVTDYNCTAETEEEKHIVR